MITWAGFLANLFQFCIERIASKKVDLALDTKKRAAWAFFQLHRALATLQEACTVFLAVARPVAEGRKTRLYNTRLREIAESADDASEQFLSLIPRLQFVLDCYDHDLSVLLGKVAFRKAEFLVVSSLSHAFSLAKFSVELSDTKTNRRGGFSYSMPSGDLAHTNWEAIYSKFRATAVGSMELGDHDTQVVAEWPSDCLMRLRRTVIV